MLWHAKYPYTARLDEYLKREHDYYGPVEDILEDEDSLRLSAKRLSIILKDEELPNTIGRDTWEEVLSFHSALAAVAKSGSLRLLKKFSEAEARRAYRFLVKETEDSLLRLARGLSVRIYKKQIALNWLYSPRRGIIPRLLQYAATLVDYLSVASQLDETKWRLVNTFLLGGLVYLDRTMLEELLTAKIRMYIEELAEEYREMNLPKLEDLGKRMASRIDWRAIGRFDPNKLPSCIKEIIGSMKNGVIPNPKQFYTIITFLANTNAPLEYLGELLYASGIAPRTIADQIARILLEEARNYKPYTCEVLLREELCSTCKGNGPLSEYIESIRRRRD